MNIVIGLEGYAVCAKILSGNEVITTNAKTPTEMKGKKLLRLQHMISLLTH